MDVRDEILRKIESSRVTASILADDDGMIAGTSLAKKECDRLGLSLLRMVQEAKPIRRGEEILRLLGSPKQVALAEETLIGLLAKTSGIATRANRFVKATGGRPKIVCGAWKKMPPSLKEMIREAVITGGALCRIEPEPFVYLDKNYVKLLGGIKRSLDAVAHLREHRKVVQIKGRYQDLVSEACEAARSGADVIFIDTGRREDVKNVTDVFRQLDLRNQVKIAFGGGVSIDMIDELKTMDIDILDIGRPIVDAPLLDMRLEILEVNSYEGSR